MLRKVTGNVYVCDTSYIEANSDVTYDIFDMAVCVSGDPVPDWFDCDHDTIRVDDSIDADPMHRSYHQFAHAVDLIVAQLATESCVCVYGTAANNGAASVAMAALARHEDWAYETAHASLNQALVEFFPSVVFESFTVAYLATHGCDVYASPEATPTPDAVDA